VIELDHLSYSSISAYQMCPRSWYYRYIEKIKTPASANLVFGSAFHGAIEHLIRANITGTVVRPEEVWFEQWQKQLAKQEVDWQGELPEQISNQGMRMLAHKTTQEAIEFLKPAVNVDGQPTIEQYVELQLPGVPKIIGYIDMVLADQSLVDFKTAARSWTQDKAEKEMQPNVYFAALTQGNFIPNPKMRFSHVVFVKTKTPQVQIIQTHRSVLDIFKTISLITETWKAIQSEVFTPRTDSWKHSAKFCDFWSVCPQGGK
jgi:hypothetical protein